jgi:hypothetical protein
MIAQPASASSAALKSRAGGRPAIILSSARKGIVAFLWATSRRFVSTISSRIMIQILQFILSHYEQREIRLSLKV